MIWSNNLRSIENVKTNDVVDDFYSSCGKNGKLCVYFMHSLFVYCLKRLYLFSEVSYVILLLYIKFRCELVCNVTPCKPL